MKAKTTLPDGRQANVYIPTKEEQIEQGMTRHEFKEAYYSIGDKLETLLEIREHTDDTDACIQLTLIIGNLRTNHGRLKAWGDQHLANWD